MSAAASPPSPADVVRRLGDPALPIDAALPDLIESLRRRPNAVLEAPPGAGKTTRAPLALLDEPWVAGGAILMLEPRRVAARAAAERLAASLGESVGEQVGYRIRYENKVGKRTRIEVITEGILTRRLQSDPELSGVAAVLFDEFHERSLHADLGLALCLEAQGALREDLRLVAMSATLDGAAVAALMGAGPGGGDAPRIRSEGRSFPVETRWLDRPLKTTARDFRFERAAADLILQALAAEEGDVLAFLPGAGEIRRTASLVAAAAPADLAILPLYGELPFAEQQRALAPAAQGRRKLVLATALAETSLTIDGVRVVVDCGRARRARFDADAGMSRLVTGRVSKAAAEQRRGRAGRTAPGVCFRLWTKAEEGALAERDPPEILEADLAGLALDLAAWGAAPETLSFLDPPPAEGMAQARTLLTMLGALDAAGRITRHGERLAAAPLHPRLAHMAIRAGGGRPALRLAALLEERDPLRGAGADLADRMSALERPEARGAAEPALRRINDAAKRLAGRLKGAAETGAPPLSLGALVALAFPDRVAVRRGDGRRYHLSGGKGAALAEGESLAKQPYLAIAELGHGPGDRAGEEARIRLAAPLDRAEIETLFADQLRWEERCAWSKRERQALPRRRRRLYAATLEEQPWPKPPAEAMAAAMTEGVRALGLQALPWSAAARRLQARLARARSADARAAETLPDLSDDALAARLEEWLTPALHGMRREADLEKLDVLALLKAQLDWAAGAQLDALAPEAYTAPTGTRAPIDYAPQAEGETPESAPPRIAIRIQELFGVDQHPAVAGQPLLISLLSPAGRPIQTTADLPGFWRGSYADAAKEMRARYPKHPWPDAPQEAAPTRRAKPSSRKS